MNDRKEKSLEDECKTYIWLINQIKKEKVLVNKINTLSISSVKQKLK